jgi:ABC-2 type transport system permease protein
VSALFSSTLRQALRGVANYALGMVFYLWLFIWVYPSFAGSTTLNTLLQNLPPGLLRVLGYSLGGTSLSGFLAGEFYSLVYLLILAIYVLVTGTRLMAHLVDNGSMAYLLATPVSRRRIAAAQALVLLCGVVIIAGATTAGGLLGAHWFAAHEHLPAWSFVKLNLVGMLVFMVVASYAFLFSALAADERSAMGLSAVLTLAFYGLHVLGDLSTRLAWVAHLSLFNVFNAQSLLAGRGHVLVDAVALAGAALVLLGGAVSGFERRQLSL